MRAKLMQLLRRRAPMPRDADTGEPGPAGDDAGARRDPRHCGLIDMVMSDWLNAGTGELFSGFALGPQDRVLDVGCGDGLAVMFAAQQGAHTTFCDLDPAKVHSLSERLLARGLTRHAGLVASGDRLPLPDGSMSRIIATEVLEHVDDPAAVLREMVRVGAPGAKYLISVPDAGAERFQQPFAHRSYFEAPNHVRIIAPRELEALAASCGLEVEGRGQWGFYWFLWMNFFWVSQQESGDDATAMDRIRPPYHPLLQSWTETWTRLLELPETDGLRRALNELMPKSRVIVARRRQER
jgi:SAM-dependent methyltransferase